MALDVLFIECNLKHRSNRRTESLEKHPTESSTQKKLNEAVLRLWVGQCLGEGARVIFVRQSVKHTLKNVRNRRVF